MEAKVYTRPMQVTSVYHYHNQTKCEDQNACCTAYTWWVLPAS
jgi:hypothetical protein